MKKISIVFLCLVSINIFSQGVQYGQVFQVSTSDLRTKQFPNVAVFPEGGFVVCWESYGENSGFNIYGQLFDKEGLKRGEEFLVNTSTGSWQENPMVVSLRGGEFIVCWQRCHWGEGSSWLYDVFGQLFDVSGLKNGGEFQINTSTQKNHEPKQTVTAFPAGGFVVSWEGRSKEGYTNDIYAQLFDKEGLKKGNEFRVNTCTWCAEGESAVAVLPGGGFVVCWEGEYIHAQLFDSTGSKIGGEFQVCTYTNGSVDRPVVAALSGGRFVVCWESDHWDGSKSDIYGQLFNNDGSKRGNEFIINTTTIDTQWFPVITALADGGFVVCWESILWVDVTEFSIYGQLFDTEAVRKGVEFLITNHDFCTVASFPGGGFVVCWSELNYNQNIEYSKICAKCFPQNPISHQLVPFALIEPSMDMTLQSTTAYLKWRRPSHQIVCYPWELRYKIFIDESPDFTSPRVFEQDMDTTFTLQGLSQGTAYFWNVLAKNIDGDSLWSENTNAFFVSHTAGVKDQETSPEAFHIFPNHPNPFNAETVIRFDLFSSGFVRMAVYDLRGRCIRILLDENRTAGSHSVKLDGRDTDGNIMPSGIYICRTELHASDGQTAAKSVKMGLVK